MIYTVFHISVVSNQNNNKGPKNTSKTSDIMPQNSDQPHKSLPTISAEILNKVDIVNYKKW